MRAIVAITLLVALAAFVGAKSLKEPNEKVNRLLMQQLLAKRSGANSRVAPKAPVVADKRIVIENYFTTRLDHFNSQNTQEFQLRYLQVSDFYRPGGPILIFLAGNTALEDWMVYRGTLIYQLAEKMNALLIGVESRFYGSSRPTEDTTTENLRFLNTDQILADFAEFVTYLRHEVVENEYAKVLVAGSEYGGSLATWFRVRYPHLADVAWSSSGWHQANMDFQEFTEAWGETLIEHGSQDCYNEIFVAFHVMQNLFDAERSEEVSEMFNICTPVDPEDRLQVMFFFSIMMTSIEMYTLRDNQLGDFHEVCDDLLEGDYPTAVHAFADWFNTKFLEDRGCVISDINELVERFSQTNWDSPYTEMGVRQWGYQECNEFGWFWTTDSDNQPFGSRVYLELYSELCRMVYGDWITYESIYYATNRANNRFGGNNPRIEYAHFTNGAEDPWRKISVTNTLNTNALADVIPRELTSADIWATSEDDSAELAEVKDRLLDLLSYYLYPGRPREEVKSVDVAVN
ncbi:putative serine protease K12H4.7 [Uranotaenia lowii]|uniref:putative serine protease K12H4.7 n=1 Tax=Uranotaenia lowii TaxID=190385 RepID=UPI00247951FB|nr:putative serine protease K12H4.7 [Uranotaenia lowii]